MSLLRMGRNPDGSRNLVLEEPSRARVSGQFHHHALTLTGSFVQGESERTRDLRMQREAMRAKRAEG